MSPTDTIAAVSSGWAHSRWGLLRLSGPAVPALVHSWVKPAPAPWTVRRARFTLAAALDLPCFISFFPAPRSFTGEHSAELILPGNPLVLERALARLTSWPEAPIREAHAGEFSARAFLNGKLTLDQAEGIAAAISAQTDHQLAAARALLSGETGRTYRAWSDELATLLALVEAGIDFTDQEDVVPILPSLLRRRLDSLCAAIDTHLGARAGREGIILTPRVVLVGPPNAGKSTLFNALLGRRRAVESPLAGTTRDALVEPLNLEPDSPGAGTVLLIDLPGLDPAPMCELDTRIQARADNEVRQADIIILCRPADARAPHTTPLPPGRPTIRIRTKSDLPPLPALFPSDAAPSLHVCALNGRNLAPLRRAVADAAWGLSTHTTGPDRPLLLPRHRRALSDLADRLSSAASLTDSDLLSLAHPETIAGELRSGLTSLAELTGHISPDDILGRIFSTFCIGK